MVKHIIPISGKDSLTTALVQTSIHPGFDYEYLFTDTGVELPETYKWLNDVELKTGFNITKIEGNLEQTIKNQKILPSADKRFCTRIDKIQPMEKYLKDDYIIYVGLRIDEPNRVGYQSPTGKGLAKYPLRENNINLAAVYTILEAKNLLPPSFFWQTLYDAVNEEMQNRKPTLLLPEFKASLYENWMQTLSKYEYRQLFAGRTRSNCYFCFFQRLSEFLWLSEVHPDLFENACYIEENTGAENFTWKQGWKLRDIPKNKSKILKRRVKEIADYIEKKIHFEKASIELENEIAMYSCGLFCGK